MLNFNDRAYLPLWVGERLHLGFCGYSEHLVRHFFPATAGLGAWGLGAQRRRSKTARFTRHMSISSTLTFINFPLDEYECFPSTNTKIPPSQS
jgi:hypothetical protein